LKLGGGGGTGFMSSLAPYVATPPTTAAAASAPVHFNIERLLTFLSEIDSLFLSDNLIVHSNLV
jgi:hypothetical protein